MLGEKTIFSISPDTSTSLDIKTLEKGTSSRLMINNIILTFLDINMKYIYPITRLLLVGRITYDETLFFECK